MARRRPLRMPEGAAICPECHGSGKLALMKAGGTPTPCLVCDGKGWVPEDFPKSIGGSEPD